MTVSNVFAIVCSFLCVTISIAAEPDATTAGHVWLGDLNCTACHAATSAQAAWLTPKQAPRLENIGHRASAEWIRQFVANPQQTMPGTTMPEVMHGLSVAERAMAAENLTHYLMSLQPVNFQRVVPDQAAVVRGEKLYRSIGCVACHAVPDGPAMTGASLPNMVDKWSLDGLRSFLLDPLATRPSGRMPAMGLSEREALDIAHYLLKKTKVAAPLLLEVRHGRMNSFDEIEAATLVSTVSKDGLTLDVPGLDRRTALHFSGWIHAEKKGDYTFFIKAVGACRLAIDGDWVIGNDSWDNEKVDDHGVAHLDVGWTSIVFDFAQREQKNPTLQLEWQGPGVPRGFIPAARLQSEQKPAAEQVPFVVDAAKAENGRIRFSQLGCAACHEVKGAEQRPSVSLSSFTAAASACGCLAEHPASGLPDYHLDQARRSAIQQGLDHLRTVKLDAPTATQRIAQTMTTLKCYVCHVRDGVGGVTAERAAFFTSNVEDAGDEGRLPPRLDGVGDRLRPAWLAKVLAQGERVRPYVDTRMPQFGAANVGHLTDLFIAVDRQAQPVVVAPDTPDALRDAGRKLVGTDGLSCIACHRFNRQPAHSLQMVDLITVPERLNEDWFRRFLREPNLFHPGTRMPALWPGGVSLIPAVLSGDTNRQHAALWTYLSEGQRAVFPNGLSRKSMEIVVGGEAVIYRGKLWEAGFRAIATGYPGQVNVAFDGEEMRLALMWRGRFLDASLHWSQSGRGDIRPLGSDVMVFPHGSPLAVLADVSAAWPTETSKELGMKWNGYRVDTLKRPTLQYAFRDVAIEDHVSPIAVEKNVGLHRVMKFTGSLPAGLHLRLMVGKIASISDHAWRINDALTVTVTGGGKPFVRGKGEAQELLVPLQFQDHEQHLEVHYAW